MLRITRFLGKFYGIELPDDCKKAMEEINGFVLQGTPVIIVEDISQLEDLDIYEEVEIVKREE